MLAQFQEHPEAWQRVPAILQQSSSAQTKVSGSDRAGVASEAADARAGRHVRPGSAKRGPSCWRSACASDAVDVMMLLSCYVLC